MLIKIIACGVFKPYIEYLKSKSENEIHVAYMDAGLHETPNLLREKLQNEINITESSSIDYDYIVVFYGLCGRGTLNIETFKTPVVFPKVHDCISLFLGSPENYKKEFKAHPGTFYHTAGWISEKINPRNREASSVYKNYFDEGFENHPDFENLKDKYGADNAEFILQFYSHWVKNYTRCAYIDFGLPNDEKFAKLPKYMANVFGWEYALMKGSMKFMETLFNAQESPQTIIIPPYSKTVFSQDNIFTYVKEDNSEFYEEKKLLKEINNPIVEGTFGLGIDAGGTYTDAVVYDFKNKKVLSFAKTPTTYEDLLIGIRNVLSALPKEDLQKVQVTALSTTLATNAMVEGKEYKVGLISYSPFEWFDKKVAWEPMVKVKGAVNIDGEITENIDEDEIKAAVNFLLKENCKSVAVGGYSSVRNPKLSEQIREIINTNFENLPVICSHDLSNKLNAVNSLRTAITNAKLVPVINELIDSVKKALKDYNIPEKLLVVKGDGSNISSKAALKCPIETIMSGPAASALGALVLTQKQDAFVIDIGGTTTDTAIIRDGQVDISDEGAKIGNWVMNVDCAKISTTGLGGDSKITFDRDRNICIGPERVIPYCHICQDYPYLLTRLKELSAVKYNTAENVSILDIIIPQKKIDMVLNNLEMKLLDILAKGPLFAIDLMKEANVPSLELLHIDKLVQKGLVKRSSFTPTDIMRCEGEFVNWSLEASELGLNIFSQLYGKTFDNTVEDIYKEINKRVLSEILLRHLNDKFGNAVINKELNFYIDKILEENDDGLSMDLKMSYPIIGIGAPTETMLKYLRKYIMGVVIFPEYANVANAVGAISGQVIVKEEAVIRAGEETNYKIFTRKCQDYASQLEEATKKAINILEKTALEKAKLSGATSPSMKIYGKDKISKTSDGTDLFIERNVFCEVKGSAVI